MNETIRERIIRHRREMHRRAEVGFELTRTREYIMSVLTNLGYAPREIGKGSIIAEIGGEADKYLLLRADMDALAIREETALPFASTNGEMHACGHDMHSAMLLGAAEMLKGKTQKIGVILLFQAGEELLLGAADVISSGLFNKYKIEYALGLHVISGIPYKSGSVLIPPAGVVAPGADVIKIKVRGKSAHGSTPHLGRSAISAATAAITAIEQALFKELAPSELRVLNWGRFDGGVAANVVAERAEIEGNFRFYDTEERNRFITRCDEICRYIGKAYECEISFNLAGGCPPLKNDEGLLGLIRCGIDGVFDVVDTSFLGSRNSKNTPRGSEDFAHFSNIVPSAFLSICAGRREDGYIHPLHTSNTDFDEKALLPGAELLAFLPSIIEKSLRD